jgi:hypothetical protein
MDRLIRQHRGGLSESMETVQAVRDREHLVAVIRASLSPFGVPVDAEQITVEPYGFDTRIDWDTYLICIESYGVWGMANGPLP